MVKRVAIVNDHINQGGVGATTRRFAPELARRGYEVTSITVLSPGDIEGVENIQLHTTRWQRRTIIPLLYKLTALFRERQFDYILSNKDPVNILSIMAYKLSGLKRSTLLVNSRTNVRKVLEHETTNKQRRSIILGRYLYRYADLVANVSYKASKESEEYFGLPKVHTLYNAVITAGATERSYPYPDHPFFTPEYTTIVTCGRLVHQKNHKLMIQAFAEALKSSPALRLIIVGEGDKRSELEALCKTLGVEDYVSLPGYSPLPQAYMAHARLFWFTSYYEGFGNVLVESLSTGTNVLSTNCEYGPSEILADGKYGDLVDSFDVQANAEALLAALARPKCTPEVLKARAREFEVGKCVDAYLALLESGSDRNK